jgi:hypothetical protein
MARNRVPSLAGVPRPATCPSPERGVGDEPPPSVLDDGELLVGHLFGPKLPSLHHHAPIAEALTGQLIMGRPFPSRLGFCAHRAGRPRKR